MTETKRIYLAYAALLTLLAVTVALSFINLGFLNFGAALLIGALKAALIAVIFMELNQQLTITKIMIVTISLWGLVFGSLTFADYIARDWPINPIAVSGTLYTSGPVNTPAQSEGMENIP